MATPSRKQKSPLPAPDYARLLDHQLRQLTQYAKDTAVRSAADAELARRVLARAEFDTQLDALIERAGYECVHSRNLDSLDFKQIHVETMRELLVAAFDAGKRAGGAK